MAQPTSSPLRALFLTEAALKLIGGSIFLFAPTTVLKNLTSSPYPPSSVALVRNFGTLTLAFSVPLFLAARQDAASVKSRRIVYWGLLAREGFLAVGLVGQIVWSWAPEEKDDMGARALEEGLVEEKEGESAELRRLKRGLWVWVVELVPFVIGRAWVLQRRGQWF